MKLYICGNGFDRNHGLKTGYEHYKQFLERKYPDTYRKFLDFKYIRLGYFDEKKWSDLEKALTIDYEDCMYHAMEENRSGLDKDCKQDALLLDLKAQTAFVHNFTGKYLIEWLNSIDVTKAQPDPALEIDVEQSCFLTFNYTKTLEQVYHVAEKNILHIHGCLGENIKLQFGSLDNDAQIIEKTLENEYEHDDSCDSEVAYGVEEIGSYCQSAYKNLQVNYDRLEKFITKHYIEEVVIMGHSFNGIDAPYYEDVLIPFLRDCKWNIYVHSSKDREAAKEFIEKFNLEECGLKSW